MDWAKRRRRNIVLILSAVVVVIIAIVLTTTLYTPASCSDNKQNQSEAGIDCGGPCQYRCSVQELAPTVLYTQALRNNAGRTDIIASIENKNISAAAKDVPYTVSLYNANQALIKEVRGIVDLPPRATVPVFIPGVVSGVQVAQAFLEISPSALEWYTVAGDPRIVPKALPPSLVGTPSVPRIQSTLVNSSITVLTNVRAVVIVHGTGNNVIAASETLLPTIPAQGQATALFTWNDAFTSAPTLIEVIPVVQLP